MVKMCVYDYCVQEAFHILAGDKSGSDVRRLDLISGQTCIFYHVTGDGLPYGTEVRRASLNSRINCENEGFYSAFYSFSHPKFGVFIFIFESRVFCFVIQRAVAASLRKKSFHIFLSWVAR